MLAISYHNGGYGSAITELTKSAAQAAVAARPYDPDEKWKHMQHDKDRPRSNGFGYGGFGAITEDQLTAFDRALDGCAVSLSDSDKSANLIRGMIQAFPDPADRVAIRQRLTARAAPDTFCVQAVNSAFGVAAADTSTSSASTSIFTSPTFWGVGAGVVGLALGVFIGRSVGKR